VPQDDAAAADWFRKAAERGFGGAQDNLANPEMKELVCHIMVAIGQAERKTIATRVRDALRQP
jgi:TPR repeat protein